ncbi:TetR/AcrR family transcriptional regulator [Acrocarpospora macrocephala]|uniref:TetR family transcriptional regulator n=2 Tax=Acrocarpospora macrocephala TaxID=150177 RepID=A0A5M3WN07_9ACTN|nr:TetR family transcriptional regulator [Acrocarpospora macrocephala]
MSMDRPLRADARRNRDRVLAAADAVFTAKGLAASTEEIAREAGVGVGTVFRHFPTKEALLEAVFLARVRILASKVDSLTTEGAGPAFFAFFAYAVESGDMYADVLAAGRTGETQVGQELADALSGLLARAQQAGAVRGDIGLPDLMALLSGAVHAASHANPASRTRLLTVINDGLRP